MPSDTAQTAPHRMCVYAACTVLAVVWNCSFGKEMAWDLLNYHFYAGFSALHDRFSLDYFAAGPQSYFNPYAYAPFYILVELGLPALAVGSIMAVIHSVVLWLTYELACRVSPSDDHRERLFFGVCVTIFALMNPVLLQQIGSSFSDITTTAVVLGGWLLLVQAILRPRMKSVIFAAILLGIATALKPTNGLYAVAAVFLVLLLPLPLAGRIRNLLCFGAALATSFVLAAAPWSLRLAHRFGNPMFPLFNDVFKSPEISIASAKSYRFIPESMTDALLRPFAMTGSDNMIAEELAAPDIRYAFLLLVFVISTIAWWWRSGRVGEVASANLASAPATRVLAALGLGFTFAWIVWLGNSGNIRYFLPMASVAAVLAVALLFRLLADHPLGRNGVLLAAVLAQGTALAVGTEYRWDKAPWAGGWFNVEIPEKLALQPNLYLSIGMQSNSFIVPFLPRGSGFVNIAGAYVLGPDGANGARVRAMIAESAPRVRTLVAGERIYEDSALRAPRRSDVDDALRPFELRVDMSDCETITVRGLQPTMWRPLESALPAPPTAPGDEFRYTDHLASCRVVSGIGDGAPDIETRRAADVVLDRLEDACPALFQPRRPLTQYINHIWVRFYGATDLTAWVDRAEVKFTSAVRDPRTISVGRADAWARQSLPLQCGRRHGIYFARPAQAQQ